MTDDPATGRDDPGVESLPVTRGAQQFAADLQLMRDADQSSRQLASQRAGVMIRRAIEAFTGTAATDEELDEATEHLERVVALFNRSPEQRKFEGYAEASMLGRDRGFLDWSPVLGLANPLAPPLHVDVEGDVVVAVGRFGAAYEGPPGCVHGGFLAAAFDDLLGMTQSLSGVAGMTGTLTVRYRRPTPLYTDLRFEGRLVEVRGRKVLTQGTVSASGELTAEADGLFISVSPAKFGALTENRAKQRPAPGA